MKRDNYEKLLEDLLKRASVLDHSKSPCEEAFIPDTQVSFVHIVLLGLEKQCHLIKLSDYGFREKCMLCT